MTASRRRSGSNSPKRTLADKLIYLDPEYVASPSLVGAFEHALERVDALAHGPVCRLRRPFEALDEHSLRAAGREARYENGAGSSPLEVATSPRHPGALNFAARRHTLERICAADPAGGATPAEQLLRQAESARVPIAWQPAAVAFARAHGPGEAQTRAKLSGRTGTEPVTKHKESAYSLSPAASRALARSEKSSCRITRPPLKVKT